MPNYEEYNNQVTFVKWFEMQYPRYSDLLIHIPNGQNVGPRVGARLKKAGLKPGVPDMMLLVPRQRDVEVEIEGQYGPRMVKKKGWSHALFIEMKSKSGRLQKEQKNMQSLIREQRYQVNTCYSFDEAALVIKGYLDEE